MPDTGWECLRVWLSPKCRTGAGNYRERGTGPVTEPRLDPKSQYRAVQTRNLREPDCSGWLATGSASTGQGPGLDAPGAPGLRRRGYRTWRHPSGRATRSCASVGVDYCMRRHPGPQAGAEPVGISASRHRGTNSHLARRPGSKCRRRERHLPGQRDHAGHPPPATRRRPLARLQPLRGHRPAPDPNTPVALDLSAV